MTVKLKDIAEKAGVSISTVSRVINNDKNKPASQETADRIWEIVKEMGYVPNQNARNLIMGSGAMGSSAPNMTIGCVNLSTSDAYDDPFFSQVTMGIKDALSYTNYSLAFSFSAFDTPFSELNAFIMRNPVDGIVVTGRFKKGIIENLKQTFDNIVYAGVNYVNAGFDEVICDCYKGASEAVEYLIKQGHTKIGFLGDFSSRSDYEYVNEHRYEAFLDTLKKNDIEVNDNYMIPTHISSMLSSQAIYEDVKKYLEKKDHSDLPTALYCANDVTAIGAMKAITESGLRIPEDISLIGFDDIEMASFVTPSLSTVNVPKQDLGRIAVKVLLDKINSDRSYPLRVDVPYELIIRDSCK